MTSTSRCGVHGYNFICWSVALVSSKLGIDRNEIYQNINIFPDKVIIFISFQGFSPNNYTYRCISNICYGMQLATGVIYLNKNAQAGSHSHSLAGRQAGRPAGRQAGWLAGWLAGRLGGWLAGWQAGRLGGWQAGIQRERIYTLLHT